MSADTVSHVGAKTSKVKSLALWIVTGLLACMFVFSGSMKFASAEMADHFTQWGYPDWFRVLIGAIEIGAGLVLLIPRTALYAAVALGVVMVGAVATHLRHGEVPQAAVPLVLLALLAMVGYVRRRHTAV